MFSEHCSLDGFHFEVHMSSVTENNWIFSLGEFQLDSSKSIQILLGSLYNIFKVRSFIIMGV